MTHHLLAVVFAVVLTQTLALSLAVSALSGTVIPFLVDFVTKSSAPRQLKALIAAILAAAAGALATVTILPNERWQDYVFAVFLAFLSALGINATGVSEPVQRGTARFGIGRDRAAAHHAHRSERRLPPE